MSSTLELVIQARNSTDAGFKALIANVQKTEEAAKKASAATQEWTTTNQRAAQKMEAMHEAALKLNSGFKPLNDTTEATRATMTAFGAAATSGAASMGLPIEKLGALSAATDLAGVGFKNLKTSAAGFTVASAGVVAAGLAIGTTLGNLILLIPGVQKAMDDLAASVFNLGRDLEALGDSEGDFRSAAEFQKKAAEESAEVTQRQIARFKELGMSAEQIAKVYNQKVNPNFRTAAELTQKMADAAKAAEKAGKDAAQAEHERFEAGTAVATNYVNSVIEGDKKLVESTKKTMDLIDKETKKTAKEEMELFNANLNLKILHQREAYDAMTKAMQEWAKKQDEEAEKEKKRQEDRRQGWVDMAAHVVDVVDQLAGLLNLFGVSAESGLGRAVAAMQDFARAGQDAAASIASFAGGNILGGIGGALGALGGIGHGIVGALFGGQQEHKQVNDMRDAFIAAAGGLGALNAKAHEAGLTLDALLNAKKVTDFDAAVAQLTGSFNLQAEAQEKTRAAMQEFGISIGEMGPLWAKQELDAQALSLLEKYKLLTAAGADHNLVLEKMGPNLIEYVNQSRQAGTAIPEDMRKIVEELISQGKLLDENGVAFGSAEEAGISFAGSLQDSMAKAAEQMERLVSALERMFGLGPMEINVNGPDFGNGGQGGGHIEGLAGGGVVTGWGVPAILHGTKEEPEFVLQSKQLKSLMAGVQGQGSTGSIYLTIAPAHFDGAAVTRQVTKRIDMGFGKSKRRTRRS